MESQSPNNQQFRHGILAAVLLVIVVGGGMSLTAGNTSPPGGLCTTANFATSCNTETQTFEFGSVTMNTVAGTQVYSSTVTFPAPVLGPYQIHLTTSSNAIITNAGASAISFLSDAGGTTDGTWTSMPSAVTELFSQSQGGACCRAWQSLNGFSSCTTVVDVIIVSNTVNAKLSVQWATATAGPWTDFAGSNVDVHILAGNPRISNTWSSATGQPSQVFLRIVGSNGGGVGDNPQFGNIAITCLISLAATTLNYLSPSTTGFTVFATLAVASPTTGNPIVVQWSIVACKVSQPC